MWCQINETSGKHNLTCSFLGPGGKNVRTHEKLSGIECVNADKVGNHQAMDLEDFDTMDG